MTMLNEEHQKRVQTLLLEFREFLRQIDNEKLELQTKIQRRFGQCQSNSDSTESSGTNPPSYRTAVPQPPARTKRKSATISTSSSQPSSTPTTTRLKSSSDMSSSISGRGALIVFEGLDRVGKSTLAQKLVKHLEKIHRPVCHLRFPDRTTDSGQLINKQLKQKGSTEPMSRKLHLLFSLNRWEQEEKIRDALSKGINVIIDRYSYSGIAYSSAYGNINFGWCSNTEVGLPKPDLVIYLELPEEEQTRRPGFGDEKFEDAGFQKLVRKQYEHLMRISKEKWLRLDVENKGPDQLLAEIVLPVRDCLESCVNKPIGDLSFA